MDLIMIGCPVKERTWILPEWFNHVKEAIPANLEFKFVFVVPEWDKDTIEYLSNYDCIIKTTEEDYTPIRDWASVGVYERMSNVRNTLLDIVRSYKPKYFLSLDSDILIDEKLIVSLIETMNNLEADAVGGLTYLDPIDATCTNIAMLTRHGSFLRLIEPGQHEVDVIMAIKLMNEKAYNIDYQSHVYGEDFGWSLNAKSHGLKIACDGRYKNKHCMDLNALNRVDKRVGW